MTSYRQIEDRLDLVLRSPEARRLEAPLPTLSLLAAATAFGDKDTLQAACKVCLTGNTSRDLLSEVARQTYLFAGYPRAINALGVLAKLAPREVDAAPDLDSDRGAHDSWLERGQALCARVYGDRYPALLKTMEQRDSKLGRWMIVEGYGKVLSDPLLPPRSRELTAVAALAVLDVAPQLRAHLRGSLLVGATVIELESTLHIAAAISPSGYAANRSLARETAQELKSSR